MVTVGDDRGAAGGGIGADAMRVIDRRVGVPLCFGLSLWDRLTRRADRAGVVPSPKVVAFFALAEIGALVIANAAVARARALFPEARLVFVTFPGGKGILRLMGFAEQDIILIEPRSAVSLARTSFAALRRLRAIGTDASVNFEVFARFSTLLAHLSGARWRAGYFPFGQEGGYVGRLVTHPVVYSAHLHAARGYLAVVEALTAPPSTEPGPKVPLADRPLDRLRIAVSPERVAAMRTRMLERVARPPADPRFVILNANASDLVAVRRWPLERYVELAGMLLASDPRILIVLTGTAAEAAQAEALSRRIGGNRVIDMAGRTTLPELIEVYASSHGMVTNDSGPAHFASVVDLPTLVLFGPETPAIFGPLGDRQEAVYLGYGCSPCVSVHNQKRSPCTDNRCVADIDARRVHDRLGEMMMRADTMVAEERRS